MAEVRKQLSQRELQTLAEVDALVSQAKAVLGEQEQKSRIALGLIFDRHGLTGKEKGLKLDPEAGVLLFESEETAEPEKA